MYFLLRRRTINMMYIQLCYYAIMDYLVAYLLDPGLVTVLYVVIYSIVIASIYPCVRNKKNFVVFFFVTI
jgi:hypothetical protein